MSHEIQFLLYSMPGSTAQVQVVVKDETVWCTQKAMAQLFGVDRSVVTKHLKNIFDTRELVEESVCAKIAHTAADGKTYPTNFYHLDAIIAVGYRVNSLKATRFRQWATKVLSEYIRKGFAMDDERLKQGTAVFGKDYFRELLERENTFNMEQFSASVNEFLTFRRYQILPDKGRISAAQAKEKAEAEYDIFNKTQRIDSDFDKQLRKVLNKQ